MKPNILTRTSLAIQAFKAVFSTTTIQGSTWFAGLSAQWSGQGYDAMARAAWRNPYVYRAFEIIAGLLNSLPVEVQETSRSGEIITHESHPLIALLDEPGLGLSREQFLESILAYLFLSGEFFVYPEAAKTGNNQGKPRTMELLRPGGVELVDPDSMGKYRNIRYSDEWAQTRKFPREDVRHFRLFNPATTDRGYPILASAMMAVDLMQDGMEWNKATTQHKGRMPGWFKNTGEARFTEEQFKRLKEQAQESYLKDASAGKPGLLDLNVDFIAGAISQKDADWLSMDVNAGRKIAIALGVDPSLLGDSSNKTYSNQKESREALMTFTVVPVGNRIFGALSRWFMKSYGTPNAQIVIQTDQIEELQENQTDRAKRLVMLVDKGIMTRDEARAELNYDAIGGAASELLVPFNVVSVDEVAGETGVDPEPSGDSQPVDPAQIDVSVN